MKSLFWSLAFVFSLVFSFAAYYITNPSVRKSTDGHAPWVRSYLGQFVHEPSEMKRTVAKAPPAPESVEPGTAAAGANEAGPAAPAPAAPPEPEVFDLDKLAKNRPAWPARVAINKAIDFPAVVNGKKVGTVHVPAGAEVNLAMISDGKLGVEYQGGGAWLLVEETDLVARTQKKPN